jgi:hypothetical protein
VRNSEHGFRGGELLRSEEFFRDPRDVERLRPREDFDDFLSDVALPFLLVERFGFLVSLSASASSSRRLFVERPLACVALPFALFAVAFGFDLASDFTDDEALSSSVLTL